MNFSLKGGGYYALESWLLLVNTQGGPRRDEKARIASVLGKTIPRLYGAGELGSMRGPIRQGACSNAEARFALLMLCCFPNGKSEDVNERDIGYCGRLPLFR